MNGSQTRGTGAMGTRRGAAPARGAIQVDECGGLIQSTADTQARSRRADFLLKTSFLRGRDSVSDPIPRLLLPIFVHRCVYVTLVPEYPGLFGQPHELNCRDGVFQNDAGALHTRAAIHRLAPNHHFLGFGRERSQSPHIDKYAEWDMDPGQNSRALLIPRLEFSFRHVAAEGELKSQLGLVYFVHVPFLASERLNGLPP
jgi:hypothetical protein